MGLLRKVTDKMHDPVRNKDPIDNIVKEKFKETINWEKRWKNLRRRNEKANFVPFSVDSQSSIPQIRFFLSWLSPQISFLCVDLGGSSFVSSHYCFLVSSSLVHFSYYALFINFFMSFKALLSLYSLRISLLNPLGFL